MMRRSVSAVACYIILALALLHGGIADAANSKTWSGESQGNVSLDGDVQLPFALESHNGLVLEDVVGEAEETRGLDVIRRAPSGSSELENNKHKKSTIKLGEVQWWYFPKDAGSGSTRSETPAGDHTHDSLKRSRSAFISLTTCSKPSSDKVHSGHGPSLPQLEVYISISDSLQKPGPDQDFTSQRKIQSEDGYTSIATPAQGVVYIGVAAPNSSDFSGGYSYEIAASTDGYYHNVNDQDEFLRFLDADAGAALFATQNLAGPSLDLQDASNWSNMTPPYTMFVSNVNNTAISGLHRSYCALKEFAQFGKGSRELQTGMVNRSMKLEEQFYLTGLNRSSVYTGIMAMEGNSTGSENGIVGGGGEVWKPFRFSTKAGKQPFPC